ncbi:MAG: Rpn family recombination-promoting nuclease/putative transposase [Lachnospiraceae bacterium]|nr:Rpn family recombination-promoting nuclease/putative transposase [Lachnospiraceae bacterium]MBQ7781954.1 Rpn family recombination-promoting nuclease/putative transposase [Lachnospiraceae bacterium]
MTQNVKTILDGLNLSDRFLFDETMEEPEVYSAAVSILLEQDIELLSRVETEKELRISSELRSIRLDVVGMDTDKKVYYTEMQKRDTKNLKKRSRYYQGQMDVSLLEPGCTDFCKLPDTCFILVAPFDIFGRGKYRYTFEGQCRECSDLKIEDGALRIFINTHGTNKEEFSKEFLDFMEYINATTDEVADRTESDKIKLIHRNVQKVKASEKMGVKVMQKWEELAYEREDGRIEGRADGAKALVEIGQELGWPKEEIKRRLLQKLAVSEENAEIYLEEFYVE